MQVVPQVRNHAFTADVQPCMAHQRHELVKAGAAARINDLLFPFPRHAEVFFLPKHNYLHGRVFTVQLFQQRGIFGRVSQFEQLRAGPGLSLDGEVTRAEGKTPRHVLKLKAGDRVKSLFFRPREASKSAWPRRNVPSTSA